MAPAPDGAVAPRLATAWTQVDPRTAPTAYQSGSPPYVNTSGEVLSALRVRQALAAAVNRPTLADSPR